MCLLQMFPDDSTLRSVEYDFYNGIAAASCIPGHSGFCWLLAIYTMPSWKSNGRTGARLSKITASRAQQQLHQHEGPSQWARAEQLFPQQCRTSKKNIVAEYLHSNIKFSSVMIKIYSLYFFY